MTLDEIKDYCRAPQGYFWMSGKRLRKYFDLIRRDRVIFPADTAIDETADGRMVNLFAGADRGSGSAIASFDVIEGSGTSFTLERGFLNTSEPENMTATFTASSDGDTIIWITGHFNAAGELQSCDLHTGDSVPDDPDGEADTAPATSSRAIAIIRCSAGSIVRVIQCRRGGLDVVATVRKVECHSNTLGYRWTPQIIEADQLTSILARLDALEAAAA